MRNLFFTLGLASVLATSIYGANEIQESNSLGLYCSEQETSNIISKKYMYIAKGQISTAFYVPSAVKNNKKSKIADVWITYMRTPYGNERAKYYNLGDVGYSVDLLQFDYANNKFRGISTAFYTCDSKPLGNQIDNNAEWQSIMPDSVIEGIYSKVTKK